MALYTGIDAFKKIEGVNPEALCATEFYGSYKSTLEYVDSKGGYPSFEYILDYLSIEEEIIDNDQNYYKYHQIFKEKVERIEKLVEEIETKDLINKVESKKVSFITREYELASFFGEKFNSKEFYFRKIVEPNILKEVISEFYSKNKENIKFSYFQYVIEDIEKMKDEYHFQVHVS